MKFSQRINSIRHNYIAEKNIKAKHARGQFDVGTGIYSDHQKSDNSQCPRCGRSMRPSSFTCPYCGNGAVESQELFSLRAMQIEAKAALSFHAERIFSGSQTHQMSTQKRQRYLSEEAEASLKSLRIPAVA